MFRFSLACLVGAILTTLGQDAPIATKGQGTWGCVHAFFYQHDSLLKKQITVFRGSVFSYEDSTTDWQYKARATYFLWRFWWTQPYTVETGYHHVWLWGKFLVYFQWNEREVYFSFTKTWLDLSLKSPSICSILTKLLPIEWRISTI